MFSPVIILFEIPDRIHIEDDNRQIVLLAKRSRREIHYFQSPVIYFVIRDFIELRRGRVFLGIGRVDAVDPCTFKHNIGPDLDSPQGRKRYRL